MAHLETFGGSGGGEKFWFMDEFFHTFLTPTSSVNSEKSQFIMSGFDSTSFIYLLCSSQQCWELLRPFSPR